MTREEEITIAAFKYFEEEESSAVTAILVVGFARGAEWADAHNDGLNMHIKYLKEELIDKACAWLEQNAYHYCDDIDALHESALIGDFRYAMEGD